MHVRIAHVVAGVAAGAAATLGLVGTASPAVAVATPNVHVLHTRQWLHQVKNDVGVNAGCFGTGSPGCLPIPMQYHGGPVQQAGTTDYVVFWEPTGSTVSPNYNSLITRYFNDIGGSSLYGVATQYYQGSNQQHIVNSAQLGGTWVDTSAYPSSSLSDADIQNEARKAIHANGWTEGLNSQVFVFLAKGENQCMSAGTCSFTTYCAYHGSLTDGSNTVTYASMPYAGTNLSACGTQGAASPNNDQASDAEISITSHEQIETVTDPLLNAWYDSTGAEIGDKCAYTYGSTQPNGANITINGHPYIVQEEFSNAQLGCSLS
ncbi:MAG: hypothetical protein JO222_10550 [Frankiales bacterium]|nr:hypothetical protein [Frankiales bacterium]